MSDSLGQRALLVALALLACFALWRAWQFGQSVPGIDYYQFWVVGEAIEHEGVTNPYSQAERARIGGLFLERAEDLAPGSRRHAAAQGRAVLETYSTPFLYATMHALASGDYERDFTRWHLLSLLAFTAGIIGLARVVGAGWAVGFALIFSFGLVGAPFQSEAQVANVNRIQLGGLALAAVIASRQPSTGNAFLLGFVLATLAMFKPNVAFGVLLLVVAIARQQSRDTFLVGLAGIVAGGVVCFATSSLFYGSSGAWFDWARTLAVIPDEIIHVSLGNYAPLPWLFGGTSGAVCLLAGTALCVPVIAALLRYPQTTHGRDFARLATLSLGLGCAIALLTATLVWEHYFLLAIPLLIATAEPGISTGVDDAMSRLRFRVLPGLAFLALLATPTYGIARLPHETYFPLVQGSALVILYGLGLAMLMRPAVPRS